MDVWSDRPARVRAREEFHMMGPRAAEYEEAEEQLPAGGPLEPRWHLKGSRGAHGSPTVARIAESQGSSSGALKL